MSFRFRSALALPSSLHRSHQESESLVNWYGLRTRNPPRLLTLQCFFFLDSKLPWWHYSLSRQLSTLSLLQLQHIALAIFPTQPLFRDPYTTIISLLCNVYSDDIIKPLLCDKTRKQSLRALSTESRKVERSEMRDDKARAAQSTLHCDREAWPQPVSDSVKLACMQDMFDSMKCKKPLVCALCGRSKSGLEIFTLPVPSQPTTDADSQHLHILDSFRYSPREQRHLWTYTWFCFRLQFLATKQSLSWTSRFDHFRVFSFSHPILFRLSLFPFTRCYFALVSCISDNLCVITLLTECSQLQYLAWTRSKSQVQTKDQVHYWEYESIPHIWWWRRRYFSEHFDRCPAD